MSDRRRRRVNDEGEDEGADPDVKPRGERPSECESEEESGDVGDLSESESTADDGTEKEDEETEEGTDTETEGSYTEATDSETETEEGDDYTEEEGLDGERQSGDGQEQPEDDKPDDDEDRKNPAYVPRKGAFYEHDSRDGFEDGEDEKGEVTEQKKIKKLWQEDSKWGHDCYREDLQAPKSREELMTMYGYDILAADQAPEAPPMTKRGRGRGRKRDTRFNDYLPRMAVIDTTEYGTDTVPSLDEDGLITYRDSKPARPGRGRGTGRGGYNGPKFSGRDSTGDSRGGERDNNSYNKPHQRETTITTGGKGSQDARNFDYPSLEETRGGKVNREFNRDRGGRDYPQQYGGQSNREFQEQSNSYNYDRSNRNSTGSGRFNKNNYEDDVNSNYYRKGERGRGGNNSYPARNDARTYGGNSRNSGDGGGGGSRGFHQNYGDAGNNNNYSNNRNDRRDNYGGNNNRQMESNWRRSEPTGGDNNRRVYQEQRGGGVGGRGRGRGDGGGRSSRPYDGGDDFHDRGYITKNKMPAQDEESRRTVRSGYDNTAPRHQQQIDSREYTSSKMGGIGGMVDNRTLSTSKPSQGPAVAGGEGSNNNSSSNNVVISNKENVQTINVTITSTTTEKKSYAKERRAKGATTIPKAGESQQGSPAMVMGGAPTDLKPGEIPGNQQYPPHPIPGGSSNLSMVPAGGAKRYSSQRQQQAGGVVAPKAGGYSNGREKTATTGLPVDQGASTLYNPAMPPPSFFQHDTPSTSGTNAPPPTGPPPPSGGPQDPQQRFNPSMLPPGNPALSFGLPVPAPGLPIPAPTGSPNIFQGPPATIGGPPAATGPPLMGPPFIAPGMMYGTSPTPNPRVPPPATPVGFPIPLAAYPAGPPPPPPTQPPSNVVPPVSQGGTNAVPGGQQLPTKPKKVYRGDIIYYAPELQQPARTTQKRPKSAIPIVDPQEISQMKAMEKLEEQQQQQEQSDKLTVNSSSSTAPSQPLQSPPQGSIVTTTGVGYRSDSQKEDQNLLSSVAASSHHPKGAGNSFEQSSEKNLNCHIITGGESKETKNPNNSVNNTASNVQTVLHHQDSKGEQQQVDAKVLSSLSELSIRQDLQPPTVEKSSGDAGRFIKGKSSADIIVADSGSSSSSKQELLSSPVNQEDNNSSSCVNSQSNSETVSLKEEVAS